MTVSLARHVASPTLRIYKLHLNNQNHIQQVAKFELWILQDPFNRKICRVETMQGQFLLHIVIRLGEMLIL